MKSRAAVVARRLGTLGPLALVLAVVAMGCGKSSKRLIAPPAPTTGSVYLRSIPSSAKVLLNGSWVGNLTPELFGDISAATHQLTFRMVGYRDTTIAFTIRAGMTDTLKVALPPLPGTPRAFSKWQDLGGLALSVAVGPGGKVFATTSTKFWVFSSAGQTLASTPLPYQQPAYNLAVNSQGQTYFGHAGYLYKYSDTGALLAKIGEPPGGVTAFADDPRPAVGRSDTILVAVPQRDHPLYRFHNDVYQGDFRASVDSTLYAIACNPTDGTIYALASDRNWDGGTPSKKILKLSPSGQVLGQWGTAVRGAIAVGPDGSVYVAGEDAASLAPDGAAAGRIQHYSNSGVLLSEWGVENLSYLGGSFEIYGLAVDLSGSVYVTDFNGNRILRFVP